MKNLQIYKEHTNIDLFSVYMAVRVDSANVQYAEKYLSLQQTIKDRYSDFEVPYNGIDNDDYVNGQGFCCDDATGLRVGNDNPELYQYYYHSDHLGSTSLITNIEERNNKWNTPYLFNAKELDEETGLYYYGARYYDARVSLWLSTDPLQEKYPNVSTYAYCVQNPIMYVDKNGNEPDVVLFDVTKTPNDQKLVDNGKSIPTLQNTFQVLAHGNPNYMRNVVNGTKVEGNAGKINNADAFDQAFNSYDEWNTGKNTGGFNVVLYSCNTGKGKNSLASKISSKYGKINVIAPTRQNWVYSNGEVGVYGTKEDGTMNKEDPGYWLVYQNGKVVEAYDANWQPGSSTKEHKVDLNNIPESHYNGETSNKEYYNKTDK
jgi:RHS repeat-associated protein